MTSYFDLKIRSRDLSTTIILNPCEIKKLRNHFNNKSKIVYFYIMNILFSIILEILF